MGGASAIADDAEAAAGIPPGAASASYFRRLGELPLSGPLAGTVPAVVDALAIALAEFGTLSLSDVLAPAITLAEEGFPWYEFLTHILARELDKVRRYPRGAGVYLQGPGSTIPAVGSIFRQPELARTLHALAQEERRHLHLGRKAAIYAGRDLFYAGEIGQRIARAVQAEGGLLTAEDLARYHGRIEAPTRLTFRTRHGAFEVLKTNFWGQGPVLLQALAILQGFDSRADGPELDRAYPHGGRDAQVGAGRPRRLLRRPDVRQGSRGRPPSGALRGPASSPHRPHARGQLDSTGQSVEVRGWSHTRRAASPARGGGLGPASPEVGSARARPIDGPPTPSPDTTNINVADARGNLFSASPSSAWFFGGVFIAGDTGVPLGNRMQAFVLNEEGHPNLVQGGKRPRTTLSPTVVLRNGKPFLALSSPGGDSQDQQALQVFLNIAVFGMRPQQAIEAAASTHCTTTGASGATALATRKAAPGVLQVEDCIPPGVVEALRHLGHRVEILGAFSMDTGTTLAGVDPTHGTLFGAADVRRERFVVGW